MISDKEIEAAMKSATKARHRTTLANLKGSGIEVNNGMHAMVIAALEAAEKVRNET